MESLSGRWKRKGPEKSRKDTTKNWEVCNIFKNVLISLIIISFYIKIGTSTNVIQHFISLLDTSKATKPRMKKNGQHKLGLGSYLNLEARIVSLENPILHPNNI